MNSIGYIDGDGRDYVVAMLSDGNATKTQGIDTLQGLATLVWQALAPTTPTTTTPATPAPAQTPAAATAGAGGRTGSAGGRVTPARVPMSGRRVVGAAAPTSLRGQRRRRGVQCGPAFRPRPLPGVRVVRRRRRHLTAQTGTSGGSTPARTTSSASCIAPSSR